MSQPQSIALQIDFVKIGIALRIYNKPTIDGTSDEEVDNVEGRSLDEVTSVSGRLHAAGSSTEARIQQVYARRCAFSSSKMYIIRCIVVVAKNGVYKRRDLRKSIWWTILRKCEMGRLVEGQQRNGVLISGGWASNGGRATRSECSSSGLGLCQ